MINQYKSKEIAITDNHMNKKDLQEAMDIEMYKVLIVRDSTIFEVKFNHYYIDYYLTMKYEWQNDSLKIGLNSIEIDALFMNSILNSANIKLRGFRKKLRKISKCFPLIKGKHFEIFRNFLRKPRSFIFAEFNILFINKASISIELSPIFKLSFCHSYFIVK
ncbi:hypothetical protein A1140_09845 [Staphylococcus felis]